MNALDEAKMAHHTTPQQEMISKLHNENLNLKEKLLFMESKCDMLNTENIELKEKLIDYQRFVKAINAQRAIEAFEDWLDDDEDGDSGEVLPNNGTDTSSECQQIHSTQN